MVAQLDERLKAKDMGIELTTAAKSLLAKRGYDPVLGARPLRIVSVQRPLNARNCSSRFLRDKWCNASFC